MTNETRIEKLRAALNAIADLGTCANGKKRVGDRFQEAIDLAVGALGRDESSNA